LHRSSCSSVEQFGHNRTAATQLELRAATSFDLEVPEVVGLETGSLVIVETYQQELGRAITILESNRRTVRSIFNPKLN